jgi:hypothetical protein
MCLARVETSEAIFQAVFRVDGFENLFHHLLDMAKLFCPLWLATYLLPLCLCAELRVLSILI